MGQDEPKSVVKRLAGSLWTKFKDSVDEKFEDKPTPPLPLPPNLHTQSDNPLPTFGNLKLSDTPAAGQPPKGNDPFIGGFHSPFPMSSLPKPVSMPAPYVEGPPQQSVFMQMALRPTLPRPQSNPTTSTTTTSWSKPHPRPPRPSLTEASVSAPVIPIKTSKSDSPPPLKKAGQEQCSGVTKAGKRCARMLKSRPGLISHDSEDGDAFPVFCHQHTKELMTPSGYYSHKSKEWVKFEDWIQPYLDPDTQVSLRVEMEKVRSPSDVPGYIYTFEIRDKEESDTIKLKVGRAVNLVKRIDQWGKQCGSKEQVLLGFYPGSVEPDEASLMKGRVIAGEQGPWCHRLERLIHLELGDLDGSDKVRKGCEDCGSVHREIFEFKRSNGHEWEEIVKPVIERWARFVELYV